jgi:hypothetical protein
MAMAIPLRAGSWPATIFPKGLLSLGVSLPVVSSRPQGEKRGHVLAFSLPQLYLVEILSLRDPGREKGGQLLRTSRSRFVRLLFTS